MSIWQTIKAIRGGCPLFHFQYWNKYRVSHHVLSHASPAQRVALTQIWDKREKSGIWLSVTCPVSVSPKAIIRRRQVRRVRAALAAAFNKQGLDAKGNVMKSQTSSLKGTLHVLLEPPIVQSKGPEIRQTCATMVASLSRNKRQASSSSKHKQHRSGSSSDSTRMLDRGQGLKLGNKKNWQSGSTPNNKQMATSDKAIKNNHLGQPALRRYDFSQTLNPVRKLSR
ncbi:hypothetical protein E2P81_ATG06701 [Venturia nashicola]|uniref:Uncharacterized protein n=1 Tax=Venturia nashicola TaxID=86259 RepID=A0A4Z1P5A0_9PEZI|nr:hypothetical protein E6O75_ATG06871 [Venturia nashicola]TLD30048.1 hypothetical protein E2P81_ATG06701 [Venturia nashicola]